MSEEKNTTRINVEINSKELDVPKIQSAKASVQDQAKALTENVIEEIDTENDEQEDDEQEENSQSEDVE